MEKCDTVSDARIYESRSSIREIYGIHLVLRGESKEILGCSFRVV